MVEGTRRIRRAARPIGRPMRLPRMVTPGVAYHFVSRFTDRAYLITDDVERRRYLYFLGRALSRTDWVCLAYAVMSTHLHLVMRAGCLPPWGWLKAAHCAFARWLNQRRGGIGPVFAERPAAWSVPEVALTRVVAYVHNNPVRAGIVSRALDSSWTSHGTYVHGADDGVVRWREGLAAMGLDGERAAFDRLVDGWRGDARAAMGEEVIAAVRRAARRRGGLDVAAPPTAPDDAIPIVGRRDARVYVEVATLVALVARRAKIGEGLLRSRSKVPHVVDAKRVLAHVATTCGLGLSEVAANLGVSPQRISRLAREELAPRSAAEVRMIVSLLAAAAAPVQNATRRMRRGAVAPEKVGNR